MAWADLPAEHRLLLENVGASQWRVVDQELADCVDIYALLMSRRRRGEAGKPPWLDDHLYQLVRRISTWNE